MRCKLDSIGNPRSFDKYPIPTLNVLYESKSQRVSLRDAAFLRTDMFTL